MNGALQILTLFLNSATTDLTQSFDTCFLKHFLRELITMTRLNILKFNVTYGIELEGTLSAFASKLREALRLSRKPLRHLMEIFHRIVM